MDDELDHASSKAPLLLLTLGVALIAAGVQPVIEGTYNGFILAPTLLFAAICLVLAFVWHRLPRPTPGSLRGNIEKKANDFRLWFGVVAAVWLYSVTMNVLTQVRHTAEIIALRNDVQSIAAVIERGVLPRHLNKKQQATITLFLSQFDPSEVAFKVISRDEEASSYRADIQQALMKAGWKISTITYADDVQEGLSTQFTQTMEHSQQRDDLRKPRPDRLLQMAFGLAGVRFQGVGGGSGVNVTQDLLTIEIGRHRKDSYTLDPPLE